MNPEEQRAMWCATGGLSGREPWRLLSGVCSRVLHFCRESPLLCGVLWSMCRTPGTSQSFQEHSGVRAAFHRELSGPRFIGRAVGKTLRHLFEDRQEGDYIALIAFDPE